MPKDLSSRLSYFYGALSKDSLEGLFCVWRNLEGRICKTCLIHKPIAEFYFRTGAKTSRKWICRECVTARQKQQYYENRKDEDFIKRTNAQQRARRKIKPPRNLHQERYVEARKQATKRWRERNKLRYNAYMREWNKTQNYPPELKEAIQLLNKLKKVIKDAKKQD